MLLVCLFVNFCKSLDKLKKMTLFSVSLKKKERKKKKTLDLKTTQLAFSIFLTTELD